MTENEAREWAIARFDRDAVDRLDHLVRLTLEASKRQNLIAPSTRASIWTRHVIDSLQLLDWSQEGIWLDVGSGAGFPGLAIAAVQRERTMLLAEPRRLRAEHLTLMTRSIELSAVTIAQNRIEHICAQADVISARAVAKLDQLFAIAFHVSKPGTVWLLPKGRGALDELAEARKSWHGVFHVEQSISDPDSSIVVARAIRRR